MMIEPLKQIFKQSSSVNFISGRRGRGKTDFALRLAEDGLKDGTFDRLAGNIALKKPDPRWTTINYHDETEEWLRLKGKKCFALDELGKHLWKMSFMSKKTRIILELCQLVRKFDAHLIGIAPSENLVNKLFGDSEIRDCHILKLSRKIAKVKDYVQYDVYTITKIRPTTIPFISKDIATYELTNPEKRGTLASLQKPQQAALLYCHWRSLRKVATIMELSHEGVRKLLDRHVASKKMAMSTVN